MTTDEILARRGLTRDDVSEITIHTDSDWDNPNPTRIVKVEWENPDRDYALASSQVVDQDWGELSAFIDLEIIGHYPNRDHLGADTGGLYLLKLKSMPQV